MPLVPSNPNVKEFTVPEANPVQVSFTWTDPNGDPVTKGFSIPAPFVRILNQYCVDNGMVTPDDQPDTLRLFMEHNLARFNSEGEIVGMGLIFSALERYKNYKGALDPTLELKKAAIDQAVADYQATQSALLANALQPLETPAQ